MSGIKTAVLAVDLWRAEREGPAGLERRRRERLASLISRVRVYSPLFRRLYADVPHGSVRLQDLPVTRKQDLMAQFDDWLTDRRVSRALVDAFIADPDLAGVPFLDDYFLCTTSGTTGRPGIFLANEETLDVAEAVNVVGALKLLPLARWRRMLAHRFRHALLVGTGGHFAGVSMMSREARQGGGAAKRGRVIALEQPLRDVVTQLDDFDPAFLEGYPSAILQMAAEQRAGRLHITPGVVGIAGETASAEDRRIIAETFGAPVIDGYAASECLLVAFACKHEWMHYRSDWMILEPVDTEMNPVPPGQRSHTVLLTNLSNRVQPVIRYDLGDSVLVRPDPCPCGSSLPAIRVVGRSNDVLRFASEEGEVEILPLAISTRLEQIPGLERSQIAQVGEEHLVARIACADTADFDTVGRFVCRRLGEFLGTQGLGAVTIDVEPLPDRALGPSGKFRQVIGPSPQPIA